MHIWFAAWKPCFFSLIFKSIDLVIGTTKLLEIWQPYFTLLYYMSVKYLKKSNNPCIRYTSLNLCHVFGTGCTNMTLYIQYWGVARILTPDKTQFVPLSLPLTCYFILKKIASLFTEYHTNLIIEASSSELKCKTFIWPIFAQKIVSFFTFCASF